MYKQTTDYLGNTRNDQVKRLSDNAFIPFDSANTDYQQFKKDLAAGVQLEDATGTVMTSSQITTFLETLPWMKMSPTLKSMKGSYKLSLK